MILALDIGAIRPIPQAMMAEIKQAMLNFQIGKRDAIRETAIA